MFDVTCGAILDEVLGGPVELCHIRYALAVADTSHFGRAAERLFITQPALSQRVRNLERELRCQLFDRSSRRVTLTPAGEVFVTGARALLDGADCLVAATRAAEVGETGTLGLGVDPTSGECVLTRVLAAWSRTAPCVRPRLKSAARAELVDAVHARDLDVAIVCGATPLHWATVTELCSLPLGVVLRADHHLATRPSVTPNDLRGERLVTLAARVSPAVHQAATALWDDAGVSFQVGLELDDPVLVRMAVSAGMGVAVLAGVIGAPLPYGLRAIPLGAGRASVPLVAVWRSDGSMQARAFVSAAEKSAVEAGLMALTARA